MGFSELALAQLPERPSRRYLDEGYRAAQQGVQLIERLRLFSRRTATASGFACPAEVLKKEKAHWEQIWGRSPRIHLELAPELPSVPSMRRRFVFCSVSYWRMPAKRCSAKAS